MHAGIVAKPPVELAVAHVEGDHAGRSPLEQAVGEAAGGGAHVQAGAPRDVDAQAVKGVLQLDPATRDVGSRPLDDQLGVLGDQLAGLDQARAIAPQAHRAGADRGRRIRAGRRQAALGKQGVRPLSCHAGEGTGERHL